MRVIMNDANLIEIFSSIQGEGLFVGYRQIFIRFSGCNVKCNYCDTNHDYAQHCNVENTPGYRDFTPVDNPITYDYLVSLVKNWQSTWPNLHHSLCFTGGEPLLYVRTLTGWLKELGETLPIYLETNGILYDNLHDVLGYIDYISMDIKLPSTSGITNLWQDHERFLKISTQKNVFVKCIIDEETTKNEIETVCYIIAKVNNKIPLILQPRHLADGKLGISSNHLFLLHKYASDVLREVRIIPQVHKFLGVM